MSSETSLAELPLLAQAGPAGLALAVDECRREEPVQTEAGPGLGIAYFEEEDGLIGADVTWRFQYPRHVEYIEREIVEAIVRANDSLRAGTWDEPEILLVECPPRHGKSTLISEYTPAWFLGAFPNRRIILCSCDADFAQTWGRKARDLLEEFGPTLYGVEVSPKSSAAKRWDLAGARGGMVTAGIGGRITGSGAHLMVIDDPVKNAEEAMSETIREKHLDWWLSTARTRIEPGGVVVVLMTRWHEGDLGGLLLQQADDGHAQVREVRLPAIAEQNDPLGRKPGEALWPDRYARPWLDKTKAALGAYWFSAMFQGKPTPDEGGIFSRQHFRYFTMEGDEAVLRMPDGSKRRVHKDWCVKATYVDLAASEDEMADYTVATEVWVTPQKEMLIRNVWRDRIAVPAQPQFLEDHYVGVMKVESIGYQMGLIQTLRRKGLPVEPVYPDKDKVTRAGVAGAHYRAGNVYHLAGAEWLNDFEVELLAFPAGEHDDQVDTIAYAGKDLPDLRIGGKRQRSAGKTRTGGLKSKQM